MKTQFLLLLVTLTTVNSATSPAVDILRLFCSTLEAEVAPSAIWRSAESKNTFTPVTDGAAAAAIK